MSIALAMLATAAVAPVSADFDRDGLADRASLRAAAAGYEIIVERGAGGTAVVHAVRDPRHLYLGVVEPGTYPTWCGKIMARRTDRACHEPSVSLAGPTLEFGTEEASQAVAIWDGGRFRVVWLSD